MPKKQTKTPFDRAVAMARTPKGKKKLEDKLQKLYDEQSAIHTIQEHARTEDHLEKAKTYAKDII